MTAVAIILVAATFLIGLLCYVWMKNSRASQGRLELQGERMVALLEEQNRLLRQLLDR